MPTFKFEAMDTTGGEVKDSVEAASEEEAQQKIRQMGYFVTKLTEVARQGQEEGQEEGQGPARRKKGKVFTIGGVSRQAALHLHPPVLHAAGRRPARAAQPARSSKAR